MFCVYGVLKFGSYAVMAVALLKIGTCPPGFAGLVGTTGTMAGRSPSTSARLVVNDGKSERLRAAALLALGTLPITFSVVAALRDATPYVILNAARMVVFPFPSQGT